MSSNQLITPKSQLGINYARLRNQTKKHNNSSLENPDMIAQTKDRQQKHEESEQYGLQFNKDNLSYIEGLINTKQNHRRQYDTHFNPPDTSSRRNHQRAKSTLEEKSHKKEEQLRSYRDMNQDVREITQNVLQPTKQPSNKSAQIGQHLNKSSCSDYSKPNLSVQSNFEGNSHPDKFTSKHNQDLEGEKLFDQFFKLNNSKSDSDFLRETSQLSQHYPLTNGFMSHPQNLNEDDVSERNKNSLVQKQGFFQSDFINFLNFSIDYLNSSDTSNSIQLLQMPLSKQMAKELSMCQNEIKILRQQNGILEQKISQYSKERKQFASEYMHVKAKEMETQQKFKALKLHVGVLKKEYEQVFHEKLKLDHHLVKLKQDNKNCMVFLERLMPSGKLNKQQREILQSGKRSFQGNYASTNLRQDMYDPTSVIEETHSSTNDDKGVEDFQFEYPYRKDNFSHFQTNDSQDLEEPDFTVLKREIDNARKTHNSQIEDQIQQMLRGEKTYKSGYSLMEIGQGNNQRKKRRDKFFNEEHHGDS